MTDSFKTIEITTVEITLLNLFVLYLRMEQIEKTSDNEIVMIVTSVN